MTAVSQRTISRTKVTTRRQAHESNRRQECDSFAAVAAGVDVKADVEADVNMKEGKKSGGEGAFGLEGLRDGWRMIRK